MLVIAMIAVMAACGKTDENVPSGNTDSTKAPEVTQEAEKTQDETSDNTDDKKSEDKEEPTEEPTKEAKKEPTKKPTPVPTKKPTPVPTKKPTPKPTAEPVDYDEDDYDYAPNYSDEEATIDAIWGRWIEKGEDYPYARYLEIGRDGSFCMQNTDGSQIEGTIMIMDTYDEHNPFVYDFLTKDRTSIVMEC